MAVIVTNKIKCSKVARCLLILYLSRKFMKMNKADCVRHSDNKQRNI